MAGALWGGVSLPLSDQSMNAPTRQCAPRRWRDWLGSYAFVLPNLLGFLVFTLLPVGAALLLSFYRWDVVRPIDTAEFVGLENFQRLLGVHEVDGVLAPRDERFWQYLYNTIYLMLGIPIGTVKVRIFRAREMLKKKLREQRKALFS